MGLDQTAFVKEQNKLREIMYWRNHHALEGVMRNTWQEKMLAQTGEMPRMPFNQVLLELTAEDIAVLESAVSATTSDDTPMDYKHECTLKFIELAKNAHSRGGQVFYTSYW